MKHKAVHVLAWIVALVLIIPAHSSPTTSAQSKEYTFPQTGKTVRGAFLEYWNTRGGLIQFGYPISQEMLERSETDDRSYLVQYFERAVFELHPENDEQHRVLLGLLGVFEYNRRYGSAGAPNQRVNANRPARFRETGRTIGGSFRDHWERNGGLPRFGYPVSEEFDERSPLDGKVYRVQYFERAVFEFHPEAAPQQRVMLSHLGRFQHEARYSSAKGGDKPPSSVGRVKPIPSMTIARACQSATLLPDGNVLVAGGIDSNETALSSAELYDSVSGVFTPTGNMRTGRACHTATLLSNSKVLITGGSGLRTPPSAELYDPATGKFTQTGRMAVEREGHSATLLSNGKVLISGGLTFGSTTTDRHSSAEIYDPSTGTFTLTGSMLTARAAHVATPLKNGKVLLTGGSASSSEVLSSAELYDPSSGAFKPASNMTTVRHKHGAVLMPDGKALIVGGSNNRDWRGRYSSAEIYDPATNTFVSTGDMSAQRFKLATAVTLLRDGRPLIAGGGESIEIFNPASGHFDAAEGKMDTSRFYMTATTLQDGRVLILGGYDGEIRASSRAWLYEP